MPHKKGQLIDPRPMRNWTFKVKSVVQWNEGGQLVADHEGLKRIGDEIYQAHQYAKVLIEIEIQRRASENDVFERYRPGYKTLVVEYAAANEAFEKAKEDGTPEERKAADIRLAAAKEAYLPEKKRLRGNDAVKNDLKSTNEAAYVADKEAGRKKKCAWGTSQRVDVALKDRKQEYVKVGERFVWKKLKRPSWSEEGSIGVQLQGGLSWEEAVACKDTQLRIEMINLEDRPTHSKNGRFLPRPDPNSRRSREQKTALVWFRVGSDDHREPVWVKLYTAIHREPPPGARIKLASLHRRLVGRRKCFELMLTFAHPRWDRIRGDGGTVDLEIPAKPTLREDGLHVAHAVGSDGQELSLVIGHSDIDRWNHVESLQTIRDDNFNAMRERFADWLKRRDVELASAEGKDDVPDDDRIRLPAWMWEKRPDGKRSKLDVRYVRQWRSPDKLSALVWIWKDRRFRGDNEIFGELETWRRGEIRDDGRRHGGERHLHDWQDAERQQAVRWRDEQLRRFASRLSRTYRSLRMAEINYAVERMRRTKGRGSGEERADNLHANIGSPGRLAQFAREAFGWVRDKKTKKWRAPNEGEERGIVASGEVVNEKPGTARKTEHELVS